jgi:hypothetical protein
MAGIALCSDAAPVCLPGQEEEGLRRPISTLSLGVLNTWAASKALQVKSYSAAPNGALFIFKFRKVQLEKANMDHFIG